MKRTGFVLVWGLLGLLALPAIAVVEKPQRDDVEVKRPKLTRNTNEIDLQEATPAAAVARDFVARVGGQWKFRADVRTGKVAMGQGSGIPMIPGRGNELSADALVGLPMPGGKLAVATVEPLARQFVDTNAALLVPQYGELVLDEDGSAVREDGRLVSIYYDWHVGGVPVEDAAVFVRLNSGNVTQFGAPLVTDANLDPNPTVAASAAVRAVVMRSEHDETYRLKNDPELIFQVEDGAADELTYRLVWVVTYTLPGQLETWEGRVDARSGKVVSFRDTNYYVRAVGGVYPRTIYENNEMLVPLPFASVTVNGSGQVTDAAGNFSFAGGDFSSGLNGTWFNTSCSGCSNPSQPNAGGNVGAGFIDFGMGSSNQVGNGVSTGADRNAFYHLNQVRRIGLSWLPSEGYLQNTLTANVNINQTCNATYNGNVNFYRAGGGCNNTGEIADVMQHEWGHGMDLNTRSGDGGTGEGTADTTAIHMTHSPLLGPGFRVDGSPVRILDPAISPRGFWTASDADANCGGSVHCIGEVYGQTTWDMAQLLIAKYGYNTGWRTSERLFFTSLPDAGTLFADGSFPIYDAYLQADDDNGNLADGTPNAAEIFNAFNSHEIANASVPGSPLCTRPTQPTVTVTPGCDSFDIGWTDVPGIDHYQIFRAELNMDGVLYPVTGAESLAPGTTSFVDTETGPGIPYGYVVMAVAADGCESTIENLQVVELTAQPVLSVSVAVDDDTPRGNRSGFADPGEEVDLVLTLKNVGVADGQAISGTLISTTPGVTVLNGATAFPGIPAGSSADNSDILRIQTDDQQVACGDELQFQFVPDENTGCSDDTSYFTVRLGEFDGNTYVCDPTPACYVEPTFDGLAAASSGASCAEVELQWAGATSNCINAEITYNVYRSTDPGFVPGPTNLVAAGMIGNGFIDTFLTPDQSYSYVVRAFDSRSGEESNIVARTAVAPTSPDQGPPSFGGVVTASAGNECGETVISWTPALEACNNPLTYEIYRSTDPLFTPSPATLIGSTFDLSYTDVAITPGQDVTYLVRARDGIGNEETNDVRLTVDAAILDVTTFETAFEPDGQGWKAVAPNDAETGNWEWGDPVLTGFQPGDDNTPAGINCWITGISGTPSNGDVDNGTTTLMTALYDMTGMVDPAVRFARWFTNDRGASPGLDPLTLEISNDNGGTWLPFDTVSGGTPLAWVEIELPISPAIAPTNQMRLRFTAQDLGDGSLVEAGIDDFRIVDREQGCLACTTPVGVVGEIAVNRVGDDVVIDWTDDPAPGTSFAVYKLGGSDFAVGTRVGTVNGRTFTHTGAALASESFSYRVTAIDSCGNESALD